MVRLHGATVRRATGPDIYVWRVGDDLARRAHRRSRQRLRVVGRQPGHRQSARTTAGGSADIAASSFIIDPASGKETALEAPVWRPVVDPEDRWAVVWDGTVRVDPDTHIAGPDKGSLVLRRYSRAGGIALDGSSGAVADGAVSEFDVRWDETGTWLAVWLADAKDPSIGRLSLVHLDPVSGAPRPAARRAPGRDGAARLLDRRRPSRLGDAARPGRRGQPGPDRRLDRRGGRAL